MKMDKTKPLMVLKIGTAAALVILLCCIMPSAKNAGIQPSSINLVPGTPRLASTSTSSDPVGDEWPMEGGQLNHTREWLNRTAPDSWSTYWWRMTPGHTSIMSNPTLSNGYIYVGCGDGHVVNVGASSHIVNWDYGTSSYSSGFATAIAGTDVYFAGGPYVFGVAASTGIQKWFTNFGGGLNDINVVGSPAVSGGNVYLCGQIYNTSSPYGAWNGRLWCLSATSGVIQWSNSTLGQCSGSPAISGNYIYFGNWGNMSCYNLNTHANVWNYSTTGTYASSPAIANGNVYFGGGDHYVYCVDALTGAKKWSSLTGGLILSSPAVSNGRVYVGSDDKKLYCLNAATGNIKWSYLTGDKVESSPAVGSGFVYVGSDDHAVYCLNATTGVPYWKYVTGGTVRSSPALVGGEVYVGSSDNYLYCMPMIMTVTSSYPALPSVTHTPSWSTSVTLSWSIVPGAINYSLYRSRSTITSISSMTAITTTTGLQYMDTVSGVGSYYYVLVASNGGGDSLLSSNANVAVQALPTAPTGLTVTPNPSTNGNVTLQWTAVSGASSYTIYRSNATITNVTGKTPIATGITATTYVDHGLTNGNYYYVVVATNSTGDSAMSNCVSVTVTISSGTGPGTGPGIGGYDIGLLLVAMMLGAVVIRRTTRKRSLK